MTPFQLTDRFGDKIVLGNKFILYRNRSIPYAQMSEMRVKGNRFLINNFNKNLSQPQMMIMFESKDKAGWFHDEMINAVYYRS
jgi:hypothetical protein